MRIDLQAIDREQFLVHEHIVAGESCYLVQPQHIGAKWTKDNLHFRSSLWNAQGKPVSLSWKKHFNWDEHPEIDPAPTDLSGAELMEKVDGSTLLVSRYKDTLITRTRGTVDATKMDNGDEIALFKQRYPKVFEIPPRDTGFYVDYTAVYEWVSPRNQIVIPYSEPDLYLTGLIFHADYGYLEQNTLDEMARNMGVKRPRRYSFDSITDMLAMVTAFKDVEGVCVYYNRGQSWKKHKAAQYLALHRFKERVSLPNLLDLWEAQSCPDLPTFQATIERDFDHECRIMADPMVLQICQAAAKTESILKNVSVMVEPLKTLSRRDAALTIQGEVGKMYQASAFLMLSNRPVDPKQRRRLIEHELGL